MASPSGDQSTQDLVVADSNVPSSTSTLSSSTPEDDGAGNIPPGLPPYVASDSADDDNHHEPSNSNPSIHQQDTLPQPAQQPAAPAQTQEGEDVLDTLQGNEEASEQPAVSAPQPPAPENNTNVAFDTIQPSATNEDLSDSSESCDSCFSDVSESDDDEMDSEDSEAEDGGASVEGNAHPTPHPIPQEIPVFIIDRESEEFARYGGCRSSSTKPWRETFIAKHYCAPHCECELCLSVPSSLLLRIWFCLTACSSNKPVHNHVLYAQNPSRRCFSLHPLFF